MKDKMKQGSNTNQREKRELERKMGFEPTTLSLAMRWFVIPRCTHTYQYNHLLIGNLIPRRDTAVARGGGFKVLFDLGRGVENIVHYQILACRRSSNLASAACGSFRDGDSSSNSRQVRPCSQKRSKSRISYPNSRWGAAPPRRRKGETALLLRGFRSLTASSPRAPEHTDP